MEEILCDISFKIKDVFIFFNRSNSITYILLNNSNIFLAQCLLSKTNFYFDGLPWIPLHFVCMCVAMIDAGFTQMNGINACEVTLIAVLRCSLCIYVLIETSRCWNHRERHARFSVCSKKKRASLPFIHSHRKSQNMQDFIFESTFAA